MKKKNLGRRVLAVALSVAMATSMVSTTMISATAAPAEESVIQLDSYYTKEMNYFAKDDSRIPGDGWVTNADQAGSLGILPFDLPDEVTTQFPGIGDDVTIALKDSDGVYWVALGGKGIVRVDFTEKDTRDIFQYFFGPRYIYNGNSAAKSTVTGLRSDGEHGIWVRNSEGAVHIRMVKRTLREKADVYEQINDKLTTFRGTIIDANVKPYDNGNDDRDGAPATETQLDPNTKEWMTITEPDGSVRKFQQLSKYGDNNDSYWTSLALLGFGNEYEALRGSADPEDQKAAEAARDRIVKGAMNCMLLSKLHGTGDGFVMRNYKFTDEPGGGVNGKITYQLFKDSGNTDETKVEEGDRYIVQKAGNMRNVRNGAEVKYFPTDLYFGDGLPNFAMGAEAAEAADAGVKMTYDANLWNPSTPVMEDGEFVTMPSPGYMLLGEAYVNAGNGGWSDKNDPVIAEARGKVKVYMPYVGAKTPVYKDGPNGEPVLQPERDYDWAYSYKVQENVSEKYEALVEKFTTADPNQPTRAGYDDAENMTNLTFYTDTSSEEPVGMFASYFTLYNYVIKPELADPNTSADRRAEDEELLKLMRDAASTTLNHIIDNGYVLMDPCGHQSTWGKWNRDYFNWDCDPDTPGVQNHVFMPDAVLNSAEMFMFTRVAMELLDDVKTDTTTSTGINMDGLYMTAKDLTAGADGYATYKSVYDKFAAEYEKMKQPMQPDQKMEELTPITPNDPKNGVGYLELMQSFNKRAELMTQYWIDDIQFTLDVIEANGGVITKEAALKSYTAADNYDDGETPIDPDDKVYLEEALKTFQDCLKNKDYANGIGNFGDALMYFVAYAPLSVLTRDEADVWPKIQNAYTQVYEGMLKSEEIPFDTYLMKFIDPDLPGIDEDVANATRQLIRTPQYLMNYGNMRSYNGVYRKDTLWYEIMDWYDHDTMGSTNVFPFDERRASKFNTCILGVDDRDYEDVQARFESGKDGEINYANSIYMYDPTPYTTGYWLGINLGLIQEKAVDPNKPASISLSVPETCEMVVGDSRSIDFVILPESNKLRAVTWTSSDESVATVDEWGRVTAKKAGTVTITATAKADPSVKDSGTIKVVAALNDLAKTAAKAVVNYTGTAAEEVQNLQKYVDRYTKDEALAAEDTVVPATVKAVLNGTPGSTAAVTEGTATWTLEAYGIKRVDTNPVHERDAEQFFMGDRYLPADAIATPNTSVIHMESDNANGLWVASATAVTHIRMEELSYTDKAAEMSKTTQENVARRGMVSQAHWDGVKNDWVPEESDNDGLWTSMYGVGELMRYAVLKEDSSATAEEIAAAKETALSSIKAVLLLSNITCRTGTVDAYVRPLKNESNQYAFDTQFEGIALKKDNQNGFSINNPQSGPVDKTARVDGPELMTPFFPEDWAPVTATSNKADFATRTRTLEGMIARTYSLDDVEDAPNYNDGYYWKINGDTATCAESTSTKVKWEKLVGQTVDASGEIPNILIDLLEGKTKDDVTYKTDTSTDEIIGHLFIYKVAYDILDDNDPEEAAIKQLLVETVRRFAQHMVDNGYCLRDATGQATTWGKTERDYFNNAYAWEDCALNSLVNLCAFKLAGYVTGEERWENEYRMLALEDPYRYADLAGEYWTRWAHLAYVDGGLDKTATQDEIDTWIRQNLNYSDEEMAMEAYYLLFQMEDDAELIEKYQDGLNAWWNSMKYSENPLWYYIYQLAYPDEAQTDAYGNDLVDTAVWALSRHPIDTRQWNATHDDRPDVEKDEELSRDKTTGEIRVAPFDERGLHKYNGSSYQLSNGNSGRMEGSTTYTLPYWMGRYHGMITPPTTTP